MGGCASDGKVQRRADVVGLRHLARHAVPEAEVLQRRLAVDARGHGIDQRHGQPSIAEKARKIEAGSDLDGVGLRAEGDENEGVPEEVEPRAFLDQPIGLDRVHPVGAGRDEDVGGRALLDLAGERRGPGERNDEFVPAGRLEARLDFGHRICQAGGGENGDAVGMGESRSERHGEKHHRAEGQASLLHESPASLICIKKHIAAVSRSIKRCGKS